MCLELGVAYLFRDEIYRQVIFHQVKVRGFIPEKQSELYVSQIPETANVFELFHFFSKVGQLYQVKLMMQDRCRSAMNRGFAFVTYFKKSLAIEAASSLNKVPFINDKYYLSIKISLDNCRIYLKGFPVDKSKQEIWRELKQRIPDANIVDVIVHGNYRNGNFNRGYVFVEFPTHEEASRYRAKLNGRLVLFGNRIKVQWAVPLKDPAHEEISAVKIVFVRNLDSSLSPYQYTHFVYQFINRDFVEKVFKFRNHAYIHLTTHEHAKQLLEKMKDFYKKTTVDVCFSTPPNKFSDKNFNMAIACHECRCFTEPIISGAANLSAAGAPINTPTSTSLSVSATSANVSSSLEHKKDVLNDLQDMVKSMIDHLLEDL